MILGGGKNPVFPNAGSDRNRVGDIEGPKTGTGGSIHRVKGAFFRPHKNPALKGKRGGKAFPDLKAPLLPAVRGGEGVEAAIGADK